MLPTAYLGLTLFIIFFELTRTKDTKFDFLSLFHLFFILLYSLPGYFITDLTNLSERVIDPSDYGLTTYNVQHNYQVLIAIFLTYALVIAGFYAASAQDYGSRIILTSKSDKAIWRIALGILFIGLGSIVVYSSQYGGVVQAVLQANLIRAGAVERGALGFFIKFVYFNFFAAYLIASLLFMRKKQQGRTLLWLLLVIAVASSLIAAFMVSARATMILAFANFYLAYLLYKRKLALPIILPLLFVTVLFIIYGKAFFYSLSGFSEGGYIEAFSRFQDATQSKTDNSFISNLMRVFSYGFISTNAAFQENYTLRLLGDWISGFASFMPDKIIKIDIANNVSKDNSIFLLGHSDYTIPTGFIASCVYSWSWAGVILFSFFYGWLGRFIQTVLQRHLYQIFWTPFVYVVIAQAWSDFLASGDPEIFLETNFWILTSLGFLLLFGMRISIARKNREIV